MKQAPVWLAAGTILGSVLTAESGEPSTVHVSNATELRTALANARPGQTIQLADGLYNGRFVASVNGTASQRITLVGSRNAVLDGGSTGTGYGFYLTADHWILKGFTVRNSQKGIMLDGANNNLLDGLTVYNIGNEAVHFRRFSRNNTLQNSLITDTGQRDAALGEGVYLGSAHSNWCTYTDCGPDRSDYNRVLDNTIGPKVTAEHVDLKEGTTGGVVSGNVFYGSGANAADSWIDAKGNGYLISNNAGIGALLDGFQTHIAHDGWGNANLFRCNYADVRAGGYGFRIQLSGRNGTSSGNVVYADNVVVNAGSGVANVPLTPVSGSSEAASARDLVQ